VQLYIVFPKRFFMVSLLTLNVWLANSGSIRGFNDNNVSLSIVLIDSKALAPELQVGEDV